MSLRDLVEGECGRTNSLVQLTSHFVHDRTFKDEGLRHPLPHQETFSNTDADQLVQQFLEENVGTSTQPFRMDSLLEEMRQLESESGIQSPRTGPGVAALTTGLWGQQQLIDQGKPFDSESLHEEIWKESDELESKGDEVFELGFGPNWAQEYLESREEQGTEDKAWSVEFKDKMKEKKLIQEAANDLVDSMVEDSNFKHSKFMKFMKQVGDGQMSLEDGAAIDRQERAWVDEYKLEESENDDDKYLEKIDMLKSTNSDEWSKEFTENLKENNPEEDIYNSKFWSNFQNEWERLKNDSPNEWASEFDLIEKKEYKFSEENPMKELGDPLEEGRQRLAKGDLPGAVLCFEAAVQKSPESSEAWQLLGTTQAENEQDPSAIPALNKCLEIDPGNLTALMALAVCYTNENYQTQACQALKDWLRQNPKYSNLVKTPDTTLKVGPISSMINGGLHSEVQDLYIQAARMNPSESFDPDVQCGLGVLFNLTFDFDKAVDCFKAALQARPNDSRMWNRLGATLANGSRSEEAVDAYHNALQLEPGFVRARYNLGITCQNLNAYNEAAEHLLIALNLQANASGPQGKKQLSAMSESIWSTLRRVVNLQQRPDLTEYVDKRQLNKLNTEFGVE